MLQRWTQVCILPGNVIDLSLKGATMRIEIEREEDGRWIAEVHDLPGVMAYGKSREEAITKVQALALRVIADRIEHGETIPELDDLFALPA